MTNAKYSEYFALTHLFRRYGYYLNPYSAAFLVFYLCIGIILGPSLSTEMPAFNVNAAEIPGKMVSSAVSEVGSTGMADRGQAGSESGIFMPPSPLSFGICELNASGLGLQDTVIYNLSETIEKRPKLIWMKLPKVLESLEKAESRGKVVLHILVDQLGRTVDSKVFSEMPANLGLGQRARTAAKSAMFIPGVNKAKLVKCWTEISLEL